MNVPLLLLTVSTILALSTLPTLASPPLPQNVESILNPKVFTELQAKYDRLTETHVIERERLGRGKFTYAVHRIKRRRKAGIHGGAVVGSGGGGAEGGEEEGRVDVGDSQIVDDEDELVIKVLKPTHSARVIREVSQCNKFFIPIPPRK